jgi:hypothetical protein
VQLYKIEIFKCLRNTYGAGIFVCHAHHISCLVIRALKQYKLYLILRPYFIYYSTTIIRKFLATMLVSILLGTTIIAQTNVPSRGNSQMGSNSAA